MVSRSQSVSQKGCYKGADAREAAASSSPTIANHCEKCSRSRAGITSFKRLTHRQGMRNFRQVYTI